VPRLIGKWPFNSGNSLPVIQHKPREYRPRADPDEDRLYVLPRWNPPGELQGGEIAELPIEIAQILLCDGRAGLPGAAESRGNTDRGPIPGGPRALNPAGG